MLKKLFNTYKVPLLVSFTLFIVLIALNVERDPINIALIFLGTMFGTFLLKLDYFLYAYFLEPEAQFSQTIRGFVKHNNFMGALTYIHFHEDEISEKTLNSSLFQIVFGALMIFVASSDTNIFIKALVISTFTNSIFIMIEEYFAGKIKDWFWALKVNATKSFFISYTIIMLVALVFTLSLF